MIFFVGEERFIETCDHLTKDNHVHIFEGDV